MPALSGAERIFQVLALPVELAPPATADSRVTTPIDVRDVVFGYQEKRSVLHAIRLEVRAGEQVALVGRTGARKTSLLHLIGGLYAPWHGSVRVMGMDPRAVEEERTPRNRCGATGSAPLQRVDS